MNDRFRFDLLAHTAGIVASHLSNNSVAASDLPQLIETVHSSLARIGTSAAASKQKPAVPVRSSVQPDYIACLEDGTRHKLLKRHLRRRCGMTPAQYRAKWRLPADYPMVAPAYAARRRQLAIASDLGHTSASRSPAPVPAPLSSGDQPKPRRKLGIVVPTG